MKWNELELVIDSLKLRSIHVNVIREYMMKFFIAYLLWVSTEKSNEYTSWLEPTADRINSRNQFFTQGHRAFKSDESAKVYKRHIFCK